MARSIYSLPSRMGHPCHRGEGRRHPLRRGCTTWTSTSADGEAARDQESLRPSAAELLCTSRRASRLWLCRVAFHFPAAMRYGFLTLELRRSGLGYQPLIARSPSTRTLCASRKLRCAAFSPSVWSAHRAAACRRRNYFPRASLHAELEYTGRLRDLRCMRRRRCWWKLRDRSIESLPCLAGAGGH